MSGWNRERKCLNCGVEFGRWDRYDKQYCGAKCRKQAERKRKSESAQELYNQGMSLISKFSKLSRSEREKAINSLKLLKEQINFELKALGDADELARQEMLGDMKRSRG